jgi:hypothetical protein
VVQQEFHALMDHELESDFEVQQVLDAALLCNQHALILELD